MTSIPIFYGFRSEGGRLAKWTGQVTPCKHRHPASAGPDGGVIPNARPNTAPQPSTRSADRHVNRRRLSGEAGRAAGQTPLTS